MRASNSGSSNQGSISSSFGNTGTSLKNYTNVVPKQITLSTGSAKPPVAPKPKLYASQQRPLSEPKTDYKSTSADLAKGSYSSLDRYSSYPSSVLINDESVGLYDIGLYDMRNNGPLEKLTPLPLMIPLPVQKDDSRFANAYDPVLSNNKGILPPLKKADNVSRHLNSHVNSHTHQIFNRPLSSGRTMSASAKNALLIEKIRGNLSFHDSVNQSQPDHKAEILPRANSNPETNSIQTNRACVVTVNNCINNFKNNNNNIISVSQNFTSLIAVNVEEPQLTTSPCDNQFNSRIYSENRPSSPNGTKEYLKNCQTVSCKRKDTIEPLYNPVSNLPILENGLGSTNEIDLIFPKHLPVIDNSSQESSTARGTLSEYDECNKSRNSDGYPNEPTIIVTETSIICNGAVSQSAPCSPATKPQLQKSDAIDIDDSEYYKRLSRGISRATDNVNIVSKARSEIAGRASSNTPFFLETPVFTFTLPDLSLYSDEFRAFLEKDLIEMSTLVSLEAAGRLNWWAMIGASHRLWPLATSGDGNCLLHAASLGMWGFHDRLLTLRRALHDFLQRSPFRQALWRRWRWQVAMQYKETGLVYSQAEWESEWENILRLASSAPRGGSQPLESTTNSSPNLCQTTNSLSQEKLNVEISGPVYESLEEIHVLALAHVLRRPIIVVADVTLKDMNGDPLAPIPFGGIYLPLEIPHRECQRSPLLLTYDAAHFSALVVMESSDKNEDSTKINSGLPAIIPVTDCSHDLLSIQFLIDPGEDFYWGRDELDSRIIEKLTLTNQDKKGLLNEYLDLIQVPIPSNYLEAASSYCGQGRESPESTTSDHNDVDKKSSESSFDSDDGPPFFDVSLGLGGTLSTKVKAPKQLQSVVKSFGSISRSMSKRIKKNLSKFSRAGSFRKKNNFNKGFKRGTKNVRVSTNQNFILAAQIHTDKRHAYQEEMIENYLATAKERFLCETSPHKVVINVDEVDGSPFGVNADDSDAVQCINAGCTHFGTAQTSYMCSACFTRQKEQEEKEYQRQFAGEVKPIQAPSTEDQKELNKSPGLRNKCEGPQYGAGRSKFYASLDEQSVKNAKLIPTTQSLSSAKDKTLFLSNSTFYNDASSIPSYNLNKDLRKEHSRSDLVKSKLLIDASSTRPSSLNDPVKMNRITQENGSHKGSNARDSLAPICIDNNATGIQFKRPNSPQTVSKVMNVDPKISIRREIDLSEKFISRSCLTKGCPFYGNSATDSLCSKCHNAKKKKMTGNG